MICRYRSALCLFFVCVLFAALSGCSVVGPATGYVVSEYCSASQADRVLVRAVVNESAAPHRVRVYCHGDFMELPENSLIE